MSEFKKYPPNTFCWPELVTTDPAAAKKFYGGLLGWEFNDDEVAPGMVYTMALLRGKSVGAMYKRNEEQAKMGMPPAWFSYVSVEDVKKTTEKAEKLGASVMVPPMEVMDIGRMAMLQDPTGAVFALWEPIKEIGSQLANEPGAFCWNELWTNDVDRAGSFYTNLFDWNTESQDMGGGMVYTSISNKGRANGGLIEIQKDWGDIPPNWLVYFTVENTDASAKKVKDLGGDIMMPPMDIPEVGRFAVATDPSGAAFAIISLLNPE